MSVEPGHITLFTPYVTKTIVLWIDQTYRLNSKLAELNLKKLFFQP